MVISIGVCLTLVEQGPLFASNTIRGIWDKQVQIRKLVDSGQSQQNRGKGFENLNDHNRNSFIDFYIYKKWYLYIRIGVAAKYLINYIHIHSQ